MKQFRLFIECGDQGAMGWWEIAQALRDVAATLDADHSNKDPIEVNNYQNIQGRDGYVLGTYGVKDDKLKVV